MKKSSRQVEKIWCSLRFRFAFFFEKNFAFAIDFWPKFEALVQSLRALFVPSFLFRPNCDNVPSFHHLRHRQCSHKSLGRQEKTTKGRFSEKTGVVPASRYRCPASFANYVFSRADRMGWNWSKQILLEISNFRSWQIYFSDEDLYCHGVSTTYSRDRIPYCFRPGLWLEIFWM